MFPETRMSLVGHRSNIRPTFKSYVILGNSSFIGLLADVLEFVNEFANVDKFCGKLPTTASTEP